MSKFSSPYYPPRARWYGKILTMGDSARRRLALDRIRLPPKVSFSQFLVSLVVPGFAFWVRAPRYWRTVALATPGFLLLAFFVWLGQSLGNVAFGLLLSLHSTGVVYLLESSLAGRRLGFRILVSSAVMIALYAFLYMPARTLVENRWLLPLRIQGQVVVVQRLGSPRGVHRGDWIAYSLAEHAGANIVAMSGFGFGPVLGVGGDQVRFTETAYEINGVSRSPLPHMPTNSEIIIPEKNWFIWPDFDIRGGHGYVPEPQISATFLQMSTIPEEQFVGKPFKRWFGRRQGIHRVARVD